MTTNSIPTPEEARISLLAAHGAMTPDEIREHAGCLAAVVAAQDIHIQALMTENTKLGEAVQVEQQARRALAVCIRQIVSLAALHKKATTVVPIAGINPQQRRALTRRAA